MVLFICILKSLKRFILKIVFFKSIFGFLFFLDIKVVLFFKVRSLVLVIGF